MSRKFRPYPGKVPPPPDPCPHGYASKSCCFDCTPMPPPRPHPPSRAAWRDDEAFLELAEDEWADDLARSLRGGYDGGAAQRLSYRHQGWLAARRTA